MNKLFPEIEPYNTGFLKVDEIHNIYYEECGNPNGKPLVFLHGGPGCGCSEISRRYFEPEFYRIILFDQRGSGRSTPHACLENNTTMDLVEDIEKLRKLLNIEKWVVYGGSWGTTLALFYSINYPENVLGLILRGIFLGRQEDIDWIYQEGASEIFPEAWENYINIIPEEEREDIVSAYYKRLTSNDEETRIKYARAWSIWESSITTLRPKKEGWEEKLTDEYALSMASLECHYFKNKIFVKNMNYILDNSDKIKDIPTHIVHGRYDMDCRFIGAYLLSKKLNNVNLDVTITGHSSLEDEIVDSIVRASNKFKDLYK